MYTTNIIEALNRQYRKVTKTKSVFPSEQSLEKMLYLAGENIKKMDSEIPWLGPGIESADCALRGGVDQVFIKEKARAATTYE